MAIKTITLRPTGCYVKTSDGGYYSPIPEDTLPKDIYLLVNEEVADDHATTIGAGMITPFFPYFSIPQDYGSMVPVALRVYMSASFTTGSGDIRVYPLVNADYSVDSTSQISTAVTTTDSASFTLGVIDFSSDIITQTWASLCGNSEEYAPSIGVFTVASGKNGSTRITQLYIEADFDIEESSGVYVRKNGSFVEASQMYQKVNGTWTEITAEECKSLIQSHS